MWIAFDNQGTVIRQINYGSPARQGVSGSFNIFVNFDADMSVSESDVVTIEFERPDGNNVGVAYFMDFIDKTENIFNINEVPSSERNNPTNPFVNGFGYDGFKFTPNDPAILSMAGQYKATIRLYRDNQEPFQFGTIIFNVAASVSNEEYNISATQWDLLMQKFANLLVTSNILVVNSIIPEALQNKGLESGQIILYTGDYNFYIYEIIEEEPSVTVIDIPSNKADKIGPLPCFEVNSNDNVLDFIINNELEGKSIILKIPNTAQTLLIGSFIKVGSPNQPVYTFEFEYLSGKARFSSDAEILTEKKFSDIFSNTYRRDYEIVNNKVSAWSEQPNNTRYPSEKLVFDSVQNAIEIAEGRGNNYVLEYDSTIAGAKDVIQNIRHFYVYNDSTGEWQDKKSDLNGGYYDNIDVDNSLFNDSSNYLKLRNDDHYLILGIYTVVDSDIWLIKVGSFISKLRIGDSIYALNAVQPDRWYGGNSTFYVFNVDLSNYYNKTQSDARYVTKIFTADRVYVTNSTGQSTNIAYSVSPIGGSIVRRTPAGQITVLNAPTALTDATSKDYVDSQIAAASVPGATFDDVPTQGSSNAVKSGGVYDAIKTVSDNVEAVDEAKQLYLHTLTISSGTSTSTKYIEIINSISTAIGNSANDLLSAINNVKTLVARIYDFSASKRLPIVNNKKVGVNALHFYYIDTDGSIVDFTIVSPQESWTDTVTEYN